MVLHVTPNKLSQKYNNRCTNNRLCQFYTVLALNIYTVWEIFLLKLNCTSAHWDWHMLILNVFCLTDETCTVFQRGYFFILPLVHAAGALKMTYHRMHYAFNWDLLLHCNTAPWTLMLLLINLHKSIMHAGLHIAKYEWMQEVIQVFSPFTVFDLVCIVTF